MDVVSFPMYEMFSLFPESLLSPHETPDRRFLVRQSSHEVRVEPNESHIEYMLKEHDNPRMTACRSSSMH